ncbi:hypothetical protein N826_07175 [Skermanella aerolata KACC 11604]|nr:hypothetical protein [Skermanella aerolata]KJB95162.1 hypothetical protein N826_07175 [Skermanella aerolata KACC 11604]
MLIAREIDRPRTSFPQVDDSAVALDIDAPVCRLLLRRLLLRRRFVHFAAVTLSDRYNDNDQLMIANLVEQTVTQIPQFYLVTIIVAGKFS